MGEKDLWPDVMYSWCWEVMGMSELVIFLE